MKTADILVKKDFQEQEVQCRMFHANAEDTLSWAEGAQLVFMDPPFNIGETYEEWDDNLDNDDYIALMEKWFSYAEAILPDDGSLWLNHTDQYIADAVQILDRVLDMHMENWCIWHHRFGVHQPNRFIRSKAHVVWYSKGAPKCFPDTCLVPSDRAAIYDDPRVYDSERGGMRMDLDVWGFDRYWGRVTGNNKERRALHPNQLPEAYLRRIILLCTEPGDLVVDPFCGSGTTATVALSLGRNVITGDVCEQYLHSAAERINTGVAR